MRKIYEAKYKGTWGDQWSTAGYFEHASDAERSVSHFGEGCWAVSAIYVCDSFGAFQVLLAGKTAFLEGERQLKEAVEAMEP